MINQCNRALSVFDGLAVDTRMALQILTTIDTYVTGSVLNEPREIRVEQSQAQSGLSDAEVAAGMQAWRDRLDRSGMFGRVVRVFEGGVRRAGGPAYMARGAGQHCRRRAAHAPARAGGHDPPVACAQSPGYTTDPGCEGPGSVASSRADERGSRGSVRVENRLGTATLRFGNACFGYIPCCPLARLCGSCGTPARQRGLSRQSAVALSRFFSHRRHETVASASLTWSRPVRGSPHSVETSPESAK